MLRCSFIILISAFVLIEPPFKIIKSEQQKYYAGRKESGGGINYKIKVVAKKSSKKLSFESISVAGYKLKIKAYNTKDDIIQKFKSGDTLLLKSNLTLSPREIQNGEVNTSNNYLVYSYKTRIDSLLIEISKEADLNYY
jgi:hypothetical protein